MGMRGQRLPDPDKAQAVLSVTASEQCNDQWETLYEMTLAITSQQNRDVLLKMIVQYAVVLLKAKSGGIYEFDADNKLLVLIADQGRSEEVLGNTINLGEGMAGKLVQSGAPFLIVDDYDQWPDKASVFADKRAFGAVIEVPLKWLDKAIGVLYVDDVVGRKFTPQDARLLRFLADHAAIALNNAELTAKFQEREDRLKRLLASSPSGIIGIDLEGQVTIFSDQARVILKYEPEEVIGTDVARLYANSQEPHYIGHLLRMAPDGKLSNYETNVRSKAGECIPIRLTATWLYDRHGKCIGSVGYFEDLRPIKEVENRLSSFYEASNALVASQNPERVPHDVVERARVAAGASGVSMVLISDKGQVQQILPAGTDQSIDISAVIRPDGLSMRVMYTGKPEIIENLHTQQGRANPTMLRRGVAAALCLPIAMEGKRIGVMWFHYDRPRQFAQLEIEALQLYVNQAAIAYDTARLLDQLIKARNAARAVAKVTALEDLQSTLASVAQETKRALDCDAVTVYIYDQSKDRLRHPPIMHGVWYRERASRLPEVPADSIVLEILRREEMLLVDDVASDSLFKDTRFGREEHVESCGAIPLRVGSESVGVMFINYRTTHRFTNDDRTNVELFANQAGVAIRNAQLYQELQERVHALKTMYEAGQAVTGTLTLQEALNQIVKQALVLVKGEEDAGCFSHLALAEGNTLRFTAVYPVSLLDKIHDIDLKRSTRIGIAGRAFVTGESQNVADVRNDKDYIVTDERIKSQLTVPVKVDQQVIGVINIEHPGNDAFDDEDREALEALANYAAIAIKNAKLYTQSQADKQRLEAVARISQEAAVSLDIAQLLRTVCRRLERDARRPMIASIRLYESKENVLIFDPTWHEPFPAGTAAEWVEGSTTQGLKEGICGWVATHLTAFKTGNIDNNTVPHYIRRSMKVSDTRSELCVPICYGEKRELVGVLDMQSPDHDAFDDGHVKLLTILADQLAVAIQNARRYQDLLDIKGYVGTRTAIDWMKIINETWGHSIRREVGTARSRMALLRGMLDRTSIPSDVQQELAHLEREISALTEIPIIAPLSSNDGLTAIPVNELIQTYFERRWQHPRYQPVRLQLDLDAPRDARVRASREWLRQALEILVDNAVYAMLEAGNSEKQLTARTQRIDEQVEIVISDTGPGLPAEVVEKRFETPITKLEGSRGAGIGLMIANTIVQTYGGSLRIQSTGGKGTDMVISLPVEHKAAEHK
jgi:PAS domain S-box-containing protein